MLTIFLAYRLALIAGRKWKLCGLTSSVLDVKNVRMQDSCGVHFSALEDVSSMTRVGLVEARCLDRPFLFVASSVLK